MSTSIKQWIKVTFDSKFSLKLSILFSDFPFYLIKKKNQTWIGKAYSLSLEKEMATHSSVLTGESQGRGSLVGCRLWGHAESDTTEAT